MIIEIKDLPEGRKVKHINVDIKFEEDGSVVVKSKTEPSVEVEESPVVFDTAPVPPVTNIERERKEVPPEMQDLEF